MTANGSGKGPLSVEDLYSLEQYHKQRPAFRERVLAHKRNRQIPVGPNATLYFEDRLTMQYQVQEMLRIERIFEHEAIAEELAAYNPLIPDGSNLKATFMLEFPDADERRRALAGLSGIEDLLFAQAGSSPPVRCIADEDLERSEADKTSAVHFVRFEFARADIDALKQGASLRFFIDHPAYRHETVLSPAQRDALIADFD